MRFFALLLYVSSLGTSLAACGDDDGANGNNNGNQGACPTGHAELGPSCVPIFDDCTGLHELPRLGGGCLTVGVTQCATGFVEDGSGGCDPVLPTEACPVGSMPVLGETSCQPVGVRSCAEGFVDDGAAGCEPVLPQAACGPFELEVLGETSCQPLGDCGSGTWGNIADDPGTVYVNAASTSSNPTGSMAEPFPTIAQGVAAVSSGGQVAIADGTYTESVVLDKEARLSGRCASRVEIVGDPSVLVTTAGGQSVIRGVTLGGTTVGLQVEGAGVELHESRVAGMGVFGIQVAQNGELSLSRVKLDAITGAAINFYGASMTVFESVVQDTAPHVSGATGAEIGRGIRAYCDDTGACGSVTVDRSILQRNHDAGIGAYGVDLVVTESLVRDTAENPYLDFAPSGIVGACDTVEGLCGTTTIQHTTLLDNSAVAIWLYGVEGVLSDTTVRGTLPRPDGTMGAGVVTLSCAAPDALGSLVVESSALEQNYLHGIFIKGPQTVVRGTSVRNTIGSPDDDIAFPFGVFYACESAARCGAVLLDRTLIESTRTSGILGGGPNLTLRRTVVRDTLTQPSSGSLGMGISVACDSEAHVCGTLTIESSIVERNRTSGLAIQGSDTVIRASLVRDTLPADDAESSGYGIIFKCDSWEGVCGSYRVEGSVLEDNEMISLWVGGAPVEVSQTVIRRTHPSSNPQLQTDSTWAVVLDCSPGDECGAMSVSDSLIAQSHKTGIWASGAPLTVERTVVRDNGLTLQESTFSVGIYAKCSADGTCPTALIRDTLVTSSAGVGIELSGVDGVVESCLVRDITGVPQGPYHFAWGLKADCATDRPDLCGTLDITDSLFEQNEHAAIDSSGVVTTLRSSIIRDSLQNATSAGFGYGFVAGCEGTTCAQVTIEDCGFERNTGVSILSHDTALTLRRTAVLHTSALATDLVDGSMGYGVSASCSLPSCPTLELSGCMLESNATAAVAVAGVGGFIAGSVIDTVSPHPVSGDHGYGIQIAGAEGAPPVLFNVNGCELTGAALAGIVFHLAGGVVSTTEISGGEFSIIYSTGSSANVLDSNQLSGALQDEPIWASVEPVPAPPPPMPVDFTEEPPNLP